MVEVFLGGGGTVTSYRSVALALVGMQQPDELTKTIENQKVDVAAQLLYKSSVMHLDIFFVS